MAASLSISDDSLTTDNGVVQGVTVDASGDVTWDGAENQPGLTTVSLQVQNPDGSWTTITEEKETLSGLAGMYSYSFTDADVISNSNWEKQDFRPDNDGGVKQTELTFRILVEVEGDIDGDGSSGDSFRSNNAPATVSVTNEANSNNAGGSGGVDVTGNDQNPSDNRQ
jgi:hypothetical protein